MKLLFFLPLLAALARAAALPGWWWWGVVFLAPALRLLYWERGGSWKGDLLGGVAFFALSFRFLEHVAPGMGWAPPIGVGIYLGGWWMMEGWAFRRLRKRMSPMNAGILAILLIEYLRTLTPMGGVPWASFAWGMADLAPVQWAVPVLGESGITIIVVVVGCWLYQRPSLMRKPFRNPVLLALLVYLGAVALPAGNVTPLAPLEALAIQANIGLGEKHARALGVEESGISTARQVFAKQKSASEAGLTKHPNADLILWAETMYPFPMIAPGETGVMRRPWPGDADEVVSVTTLNAFQERRIAELFETVPSSGGFFLAGSHFYQAVEKESGGWSPRHSAVAVFNKEGVLLDQIAKSELVPFGEQLPLDGHFPGAKAMSLMIFGGFGLFPDFARPDLPGPLEWNGWKIGAAVCWENVFEGVFRHQAMAGAEAFLILSNENWYGLSEEMDQMVAATQFRALETGRAIFRATNTGRTVLISAAGQVTAEIPAGEVGFLGVSLARIGGEFQTPYMQWGWLFLPLLALGAFLSLLRTFLPDWSISFSKSRSPS